MDSTKATRQVLFGIEVTLLGGVLVLAVSGMAVVGVIVAGAGFFIALSGYQAGDRG